MVVLLSLLMQWNAAKELMEKGSGHCQQDYSLEKKQNRTGSNLVWQEKPEKERSNLKKKSWIKLGIALIRTIQKKNSGWATAQKVAICSILRLPS